MSEKKVKSYYSRLPVVAIVGQPNVGKSTLFNRIAREKKAVVLPTPGLTRDRNYADALWDSKPFLIVDTGGFQPWTAEDLSSQMSRQVLIAIEEASAIIFLTDVNTPASPVDLEIARLLRRSGKPVFLTVNKCDNQKLSFEAQQFTNLGLDNLFPISAIHNQGIANLLDAVVKTLPELKERELSKTGIRIAVIGRQNVGKSTLVNTILGEERVIVDETPGTTRDSIDTTFEREGVIYTIIDTAGIRRRGKIRRGAERLSVRSSLRSLDHCDIALILIDGVEGPTAQDTHIAGYVLKAYRACILLVNKTDVIKIPRRDFSQLAAYVRKKFSFLNFAPLLFISALTGEQTDSIFAIIQEIYPEFYKRVETNKLNQMIEKLTKRFSLPTKMGQQFKIKYAVQIDVAPPTFCLFVNNPRLVHFSYERYLKNELRQAFGFTGCPIKIRLRKSK